ncbi:MAG TPA: AAA family ATPase, partial [Actinomycetota bacterium]|nr:AAA family ATPase [Actinomycetota bacterium]
MTSTTAGSFVGRAEELDRLVALLGRAERGRPAVGLIAGDAGVGKTRLLDELAARAEGRGARVLVGGCMEVGDVGLPYVPFVDAFRDLGTRPGEAEVAAPLAAAVPSLGRLLPEPVTGQGPAPPGDGFERVQLFDGVLSLLVRLSELAPLLLVIEDLHWADRSTRDLLAFLIRTLRGGRVALVASYRSDELHRRHPLRPLLAELVRLPELERIELAPFGRVELAEHLQAIAGHPVPATVVDRILARSEGNAFFAEELVAAGAIRADIALPDALADVLLGRIEALPELAQEILKVAAVAGRRVGHDLLVAASGRPEAEVERGLRDAVAGQVLVASAATESYRFRHALLQEAVYGDLLPGERTRLHATYARLLAAADPDGEDGSGSAAELAWHCLASHDLPGGLAALVRAADHAATVFAPSEAFRHLTQALELWNRVPDADAVAGVDRVEVLVRAAEAASHSGEFRQAVGLAREAVATIDEEAEPLRAAEIYERLSGYVLDAELEFERVEEPMLAASRRAVELVPEQPPTPLRARVAAGLARSLMVARDYEGARRWGDEALAVARAAGSVGDEARALVVVSLLELRFGDVETARQLLRGADEAAAAAGNRPLELEARHALGLFELDLGNLAAACTALDQATELAERSGLAWSGYGIDSRVLRCIAHYAAGSWDEAERVAAAADERRPAVSAAALYVEVGRGRAAAAERLARLAPYRAADPYVAYLAGGCEADLVRWQGDPERSSELARDTLATQEEAGAPWVLSAIWPAALALAAEGDLAERARAAGDLAAQKEHLAVGTDVLERARSALQRARDRGRQVGPEALAWLARAEAEWTRVEGRPDPARWAAAADAFGYGYLYEEARCRWRLAEAWLLEGDRDQAATQARAAHELAERLGAAPLLEALESLGRRGRLDLGVQPPPSPDGPALTPRELEVLRLVAAGRSNGQIAEALFISRKTASVHVSNILAKLGVHTRTEAAAAAHRLGLDDAP